jgi:uncharacterized membrane protein
MARVAGRPAAWKLVLAYLPLAGALVLALSRKEEELARWHARNGLAFFGVVAATFAVATLVTVLFPTLLWIWAAVLFLGSSLYAFVAILATVKALQGERLIVPGVSRYAGRFRPA